MSGWDQPFTVEDMYDWETATEPARGRRRRGGSRARRRATTRNNQGHLVGEVVRRITGKTLKQFVAEEIAGPLGADFQIGARPRTTGTGSRRVVPPPPLPIDLAALDPDSAAGARRFTGPVAAAEAANTPGWRRADMGALNGHGNARGRADGDAALTLARAGGVRLLAGRRSSSIFERAGHGVDLVLGVPLRFGIGYALPPTEAVPYLPAGQVCFWGGWGGSMIVIDLDRAPDDQLHDEPDGARHHRLTPQ